MTQTIFKAVSVVSMAFLVIVAFVIVIAQIDHHRQALSEKPAVQSSLWLQPAQIVTNAETHEFEFMFQTDVPNMGALVMSRLPGDPTWYFEAHHNARIWTCQLNSKIWKDCRVLLLHEP